MNIPKLLIVSGIVLVVLGVLGMIAGRFINLGRLPGDIAIERGHFKFYFPIVTCIIASVALSLIAYVIRWFMK